MAAVRSAAVSVACLASLASVGCAAEPAPPPVTVTVTRTVIATPSGFETGTFVMPGLVGANLQEAQDRLQSLGSFVLDQQDATGQGRLQLIDSNWTVCRQEPPEGTRVPITSMIVLASVKSDEACPGGYSQAMPSPSVSRYQ